MIVSVIAAMGKNRVIGKNNQMMWHLPLEYKYFKQATLNHCIITGRKNFEAMGRALPKRINIVITRQQDLVLDGCVVVNSLQEALEYAKNQGETEVFICGGGQIYQESIHLADKIYLTEVDYEEAGDVHFPDFDESLYEKKLIQSADASDENLLAWQAYLYTKKQ